ncbi:recombinase family protein [Christensenellaceae bacterium OttesenSCG-928-M15]|nr:recombinase family protein [Christensenellaceae bacterium OttesenSCG-928-M15]
MAKTVTLIPAKASLQELSVKKGLLRVAAYCRVSTDDEEQLTSYKNQIGVYTQLIEENTKWKLAGIFADEGLSGTSAKKRPEFNRMMSACRRGRIDRIITKSVSRFARNTVDCLHYVRMLKELSISVYFEKEGIDAADMTSEMVLTIFSSFAQAESESISANVAWGKRKAFKDGKVPLQYMRLIGYRKGKDGNPEIEPEGAKIVRRIFRAYLMGQSSDQIIADLKRDDISSTSKQGWNKQQIMNMLKNEKYMGDALLQKSYVVDCISKQTRKNNGELPQYYVKDNHPAIVTREMFHKVQEEIARRNSKVTPTGKAGVVNRGRFSCKYALTELMRCEECGAPYRRTTWTARGQKRVVWRCLTRLQSGKEVCKKSPTLLEKPLHETIMQTIQENIVNTADMKDEMEEIIASVVGAPQGNIHEQIENTITGLYSEMMNLQSMLEESSASDDHFDQKLMDIYAEIEALRNKQSSLKKNDDNQHRLQEIMDTLENEAASLDVYSDDIVRHEVEQILVCADNRLLIRFKNGTERLTYL